MSDNATSGPSSAVPGGSGASDHQDEFDAQTMLITEETLRAARAQAGQEARPPQGGVPGTPVPPQVGSAGAPSTQPGAWRAAPPERPSGPPPEQQTRAFAVGDGRPEPQAPYYQQPAQHPAPAAPFQVDQPGQPPAAPAAGPTASYAAQVGQPFSGSPGAPGYPAQPGWSGAPQPAQQGPERQPPATSAVPGQQPAGAAGMAGTTDTASVPGGPFAAGAAPAAEPAFWAASSSSAPAAGSASSAGSGLVSAPGTGTGWEPRPPSTQAPASQDVSPLHGGLPGGLPGGRPQAAEFADMMGARPGSSEDLTARAGTEDSLGSWLLAVFLSVVPVLGLIYLLVVAFGSGRPQSRRSWARAMLIVMVAGAVVTGIVTMVFGISVLSFAAS